LKRNVVVIGAGAIGLLVAAMAARSCDVLLLERAKANEEGFGEDSRISIDLHGFKSDRIAGIMRNSFSGIDPSRLKGAIVIIAVKATDLENLLSQLTRCLPEARAVLLLQNGLGIQELASRIVPEARFVRLLVNVGVEKLGEYEIHIHGAPRLTMSLDSQASALSAELECFLAGAGFEVSIRDPAVAEWRKTAINIVVNSLCTLVEGNNASLIQNPSLWKLAREMLEELRILSQALDLGREAIPSDQEVWDIVNSFGGNYNSTLIDLRRGRTSEMSFFLGTVCKLAESHGIDLLTCKAVYDLFMARENAFVAT
jgi:2-dehydropantoate 2-reductase